MRAARQSCRWSLADFARALGLARSTVGHWETGRRTPLWAQIAEVARVTGYPLPGSPALAPGEATGGGPVLSEAQWQLVRQSLEVIGRDGAVRIAAVLQAYADVVQEAQRLTAEAAVRMAQVGRSPRGRKPGGGASRP